MDVQVDARNEGRFDGGRLFGAQGGEDGGQAGGNFPGWVVGVFLFEGLWLWRLVSGKRGKGETEWEGNGDGDAGDLHQSR